MNVTVYMVSPRVAPKTGDTVRVSTRTLSFVGRASIHGRERVSLDAAPAAIDAWLKPEVE